MKEKNKREKEGETKDETMKNAREKLPEDQKTKKKGFSVGPDHLPDGTYRRKSECYETSEREKKKKTDSKKHKKSRQT